MRRLKTGCVQVYTGNGKGKTTAALGLALRASGAGLKVFIQQFAKNRASGETCALKRLKNIEIARCGKQAFIIGRPDPSDIECAKKGFALAREKVMSGKFDVVILDEVNVAMDIGLIDANDVRELVKTRPQSLELVLTGRNCPASIIKLADLVTEMKELKHPYRKGLLARQGIEY